MILLCDNLACNWESSRGLPSCHKVDDKIPQIEDTRNQKWLEKWVWGNEQNSKTFASYVSKLYVEFVEFYYHKCVLIDHLSKSTSNITFQFNQLLLITLNLAQLDSYTFSEPQHSFYLSVHITVYTAVCYEMLPLPSLGQSLPIVPSLKLFFHPLKACD